MHLGLSFDEASHRLWQAISGLDAVLCRHEGFDPRGRRHPDLDSKSRGGADAFAHGCCDRKMFSGGSLRVNWVGCPGEGTVTLEPDMAVLNIGVETEARTVSAARDEAATAMAAIVAAVKGHGLADVDIQTTSFNVWPRYDYFERTQVLAGYQVSNSVSIKIRDLDKVGEIIDGVADSGRDATRINGISFTVEDPTVWTAPFTGEYAWPRSENKVFEYACHEANYALEGIMKGARLLEADFRGEEPEGVVNPTR